MQNNVILFGTCDVTFSTRNNYVTRAISAGMIQIFEHMMKGTNIDGVIGLKLDYVFSVPFRLFIQIQHFKENTIFTRKLMFK